MFTNSTEYYDRIYSEFKDYAAEAKAIDSLIKDACPNATTVLDVACGTGEHARILTNDYGYGVDGIDLEEGFVEIARRKCPDGIFECGDMLDFDLGRTYDVVECLFSSIAYVRTIENTATTIGNFARHMNPHGIIIVEPWLSPEEFFAGRYYLHTVDADDLKIARMSYSEVTGNISRMTFEYLIGIDGKLLRESEVHEMGMLTNAEYSECFQANNLEFKYDEKGLMGRGLFVAWKES